MNFVSIGYIAPGSGLESRSRSRRGRGSGALLLPTVKTVLRIRDVYPGSRIRLFTIPDPNFFHTDPCSTSKILNILTQKIVYKLSEWFGLFIPDPDPDFLPIPDPGVKKAPDPGSATLVKTNSRLTSSLPYRRMSHRSSCFSEAFVPWVAPPLHPRSLNHKPFVVFWIRQGLLPSWSCSPFLGPAGNVKNPISLNPDADPDPGTGTVLRWIRIRIQAVA